MAEIVKLWAKQTVNSTLYHHNGLDIILIHNLPLNSKVLMWRESGNWTKPYCLLAIEDKICCIQLPSRLTNFTNGYKSY